jgi:hypothetical protein
MLTALVFPQSILEKHFETVGRQLENAYLELRDRTQQESSDDPEFLGTNHRFASL